MDKNRLKPIKTRMVSSILELDRQDWDAMVGQGSPFCEWDWLAALEQSGSVAGQKGWRPLHLIAEDDAGLLGACPAYLKDNSEGEFVFDQEFASLSRALGREYYPKLLVGVPFTPVAGTRLLSAPRADRKRVVEALAGGLLEICESMELSSVHINFLTENEADLLQPLGFLPRLGLQFHWENAGYSDFSGYLESFRSRRRNQIKRERKALSEQGVVIRVIPGEEAGENLARVLFRLHSLHVGKLYWGRLYFTEEFFPMIFQSFKRNLCLLTAEKDGEIIAGTFNVQKGEVFYGRYWGALQELPFLHFNVCYYSAIEHCIRRGLKRMEPGAGGEFKYMRGFQARLTHSLHHFRQPELSAAAGRFLPREREYIRLLQGRYNENSPLKRAPGEMAPED
ncbi:MAG: GNAT family N-acetyltransferase [Deltaproteobacteria bacterium]|nr:GNAT family N-acetyltransferase [Deltaproteobacteria bacterium]